MDGIPFNDPVEVPRNLIILAYFYKSYNLSLNVVTRNFLTPCRHLFARDKSRLHAINFESHIFSVKRVEQTAYLWLCVCESKLENRISIGQVSYIQVTFNNNSKVMIGHRCLSSGWGFESQALMSFWSDVCFSKLISKHIIS